MSQKSSLMKTPQCVPKALTSDSGPNLRVMLGSLPPRGQGHACSTYFCQALAQLVLEHSAVLEEGSERLSTRQAQESRFAEEES